MSFSNGDYRYVSENNSSSDCSTGGEIGESSKLHWTKSEHASFLKGLRTFGKNWSEVSLIVGSRSEEETKYYGENYFRKISKMTCKGGKKLPKVNKIPMPVKDLTQNVSTIQDPMVEIKAPFSIPADTSDVQQEIKNLLALSAQYYNLASYYASCASSGGPISSLPMSANVLVDENKAVRPSDHQEQCHSIGSFPSSVWPAVPECGFMSSQLSFQPCAAFSVAEAATTGLSSVVSSPNSSHTSSPKHALQNVKKGKKRSANWVDGDVQWGPSQRALKDREVVSGVVRRPNPSPVVCCEDPNKLLVAEMLASLSSATRL